MSSPGSKRTYEATLEGHVPLPSEHIAMAPYESHNSFPEAGRDDGASSRASTPLSSIPDQASTRPSSPPSGTKQTAQIDMPNKKRKLTFVEKETLRIEKEFKAQAKAEERAKREVEKESKKEEKRLKADEAEQKRKQKEAEREEKRKQQEEAKEEKRKAKEAKDAAKDAEQAQKETERKAKEKEKAKKDRSQLRLSSFFVKHPSRAGSATSSRRSSITSAREGSPAKPLQLASVSDKLEDHISAYDKMFPAFFLHVHTQLAPIHRYQYDAESLAHVRSQIENGIRNSSQEPASSLKRTLENSSFEPFSKRRKLGGSIVPVKELISKMNGTSTTAIDLTGTSSSAVTDQGAAQEALRKLSKVPVKYLKYAEDVRPPYIGTYTKLLPTNAVTKLCRNPFIRALPTVDYNYDSEAEWEEPEEGEDLNSDDDEEDVEDEGDDMDGFLDDEDLDSAPKRRNVMGDMEPVCTPLFWQTGSAKGTAAKVSYGSSSLDLAQFRIAPLLVSAVGGPIDPFSAAYWEAPAPAVAGNGAATTEAASMAPPPPPSSSLLSAPPGSSGVLPAAFTTSSLTLGSKTQSANGQKPVKAAKPFPLELLASFKLAIEGSDLSKVGLIEVLKKKFPQVTGKTVSETLPQVARREGKSAAAKWVLI